MLTVLPFNSRSLVYSPDEFEGGHIRGAENFMDPFDVQHYLFPPDTDKKQVFIFHCEFSSKRAPKM